MRARIIDIISEKNNLDAGRLHHLSLNAQFNYKRYTIPKKDGSDRVIYHPSKELKFIQRWLAKKVFSKFPVHEKAFAYTKKNNVRNHAAVHSNSNYILKIDFKDFFPSLKASYVEELLRKFQYKDGSSFTKMEIEFVTRIVTRKGSLPIGAPSSPIISNTLMYDFDSYWESYCREIDVVYSRYADDLYFSTGQKDILSRVHKDFESYLKSNKKIELSINAEKLVHTSKKRRRIVTGLYLTSDNKISLGRDKKREIKSCVFDFINGRSNQNEKDYLKGFLSYAHSVEPSFIVSLRRKYGDQHINSLMEIS